MTIFDPFALGATYLWRVALHSFLAGLVVYAWVRHLRLPSGATKRVLLALVLVLPLLTAAAPGRRTATFRDEVAWFDSARLLALPVAGPVSVAHLVLAIGAVSVVATLLQEVGPALGRAGHGRRPVPDEVAERVRALPGWERAELRVVDAPGLLATASGSPRRPRLTLSAGLLERFAPEAVDAVVRHEHAHARPARWWAVHALFGARLVQAFNPFALWAFREYLVETEIACDAEAVAVRDPRPLARALLAVYEATDPRDLAARAILRRRVDLLLGRNDESGTIPGPAAVAAVAALLAALLPWVV